MYLYLDMLVISNIIDLFFFRINHFDNKKLKKNDILTFCHALDMSIYGVKVVVQAFNGNTQEAEARGSLDSRLVSLDSKLRPTKATQ